ncbi:unnamed protein product, partial [Symbiodinium microadriaticum]
AVREYVIASLSQGGSGDYNKYFSPGLVKGFKCPSQLAEFYRDQRNMIIVIGGVQFDALDKEASAAGEEEAGAGSDDDVGSSDTQSSRQVPSGTTDGGPKGGLPAVTNDFRQYMDYSKYMGISHQYTQKDWMSEWQKFQQEGSQDQQVPYSPKDCKTEAELNALVLLPDVMLSHALDCSSKDKQTKIAKTWIPSMYQEPTLSSIDKEYKDNLERIKHPKSQDAAAPQPEPVMLSKEAQAPQPRLERPSAAGARSAQTATELVAWRGQMGAMVESLPAKEQAEWNAVLDGEMKAAFKRLGADSETSDVNLLATKVGCGPRIPYEFLARSEDKQVGTGNFQVPAAQKSSNFSRTLLVYALVTAQKAFVVSFSMPVAGMYIYRAIKQVPGTDLDARFLAADGGISFHATFTLYFALLNRTEHGEHIRRCIGEQAFGPGSKGAHPFWLKGGLGFLCSVSRLGELSIVRSLQLFLADEEKRGMIPGHGYQNMSGPQARLHPEETCIVNPQALSP